MDKSKFDRLSDVHNITGKTLEGCRLVLIDGLSYYSAAKITGVNRSTVGRALKRMDRKVCDCCGRPE